MRCDPVPSLLSRILRGPVGSTCLVLSLLAVAEPATAQSLNEETTKAEEEAQTGDWRAALARLLRLDALASTAEDHRAIGQCLGMVAAGLYRVGDLPSAVRAAEAVLSHAQLAAGGVPDVNTCAAHNLLAQMLIASDRLEAAMSQVDAALQVARGAHIGDDRMLSVLVAARGQCLVKMGRSSEALPALLESLAMRRRVVGDTDDVNVAFGLHSVGHALLSAGRFAEAVGYLEDGLRMRQRLRLVGDERAIGAGLIDLAACFTRMGHYEQGLQYARSALAHVSASPEGRDGPDAMMALQEQGYCLRELDRVSEALPSFEIALAIAERLYGAQPHSDVSGALSGVGTCLLRLGRAAEALPRLRTALEINRRLYEGAHTNVVSATGNVAVCLERLGRATEALPLYREALDVAQRVDGVSVRDVAIARNNLATCLVQAGRAAEAIPEYEAAAASLRASSPGEVLPDLPIVLDGLGRALLRVGRPRDALSLHREALTCLRKVYGDAPHSERVAVLTDLAVALEACGEIAEALTFHEQAIDVIEALRWSTNVAPASRQSLFDLLKAGGCFEAVQRLSFSMQPARAFLASERGRSRDLLDRLVQGGDTLAVAQQTVVGRGDSAGAARLSAVGGEIATVLAEKDRLLRQRSDLGEVRDESERVKQREALTASSDASDAKLRRLLDEQARLLADALPVGRVRTASEIRSALQEGELLLEYTAMNDVTLLYVVGGDKDIEAFDLSRTAAPTGEGVPGGSRLVLPLRGREPGGLDPADASRALDRFASLMPRDLWPRIRGSKRVFVAAHRALHQLPFESLVTDVKDGVPTYWIDSGPPVSYVPSGSVLHWLRTRKDSGAAPTIDFVAAGDPALGDSPKGAGTSGAVSRLVPHGDLERIRELQQLEGARAEVRTIAAAFHAKEGKAEVLLDHQATETAVFNLATRAKYLHFACHGIAEEYAGQSLSMLVLSQPQAVQPNDDGFLKLTDLFHTWNGHLDGCELVTLSACRTYVGPTLRDDAPQALPIGFLFAGAPAVISTLWAVDDASTKELMTDFYSRLLAGEADKLAAFTAAKKALRAKFPAPFHWAPFLYIGAPD